MKPLRVAQFGHPVLRATARQVPAKDIKNPEMKRLIKSIRELLYKRELGVAMAAPQVGESVALVVVSIRPLKHRKDVEPFEAVLINPEITETFGRKAQLYEGCISGGPGKAALFAKVPRYKKVRVKYYDENGTRHEKTFEGLKAQIMQHEIDHLHGTLFVDRVTDTLSYVSYAEYIKLTKQTPKR